VSHFASRTLCTLILVALIPMVSSSVSHAQEKPKSRDQLYDEIAAEVALLERQGNLLKRVVQLVRPNVVHIEAKKIERGISGSKSVEEAGSGVIFALKGRTFIITNRHVVNDSPLADINIQASDRRVMHPIRILEDPETDIAVLEVETTGLLAARLGDSSKVEIGDFVLAIGSPFGLSHSVSYGIISAKGRRDLELGPQGVRYQDFIQTDAAINPGNSGGPLLNLRGEVIGINTAIASNSGSNEGIGFAIPVNMVRKVATQLIEKGRVSRAFLGVHLDSKFDSGKATNLGMPRLQGARVSGITPRSPAEVAGFEVSDVILKFNGVIVDDDNHLVNLVSLTPLESAVEVIVWRNRKLKTFSTKVGDRSKLITQ